MDFTNIITATVVVLIIGALLGLLLAIADRYLEVKVDERIIKVISMLPGYNCGACGEPGCSGLAAKLVSGEVKKVGQCRPIKQDAKAAIKEYLESTPGPDGNTLKVEL